MKIAFVYPPYRHKIFAENISVVDEEFGKLPPINLGYAAAIAEKQGHEVILIDSNALRITISETIEKIENFSAQVLGFNLTTYMFHDTLRWIKKIKKKTGLPVIAGGINLLYYPKETLSHLEIDYAIIGEGAKPLAELIDNLEGKKEISNIQGVAYRDNGRLVVNNPSGEMKNCLKGLPFPARHLMPVDSYCSFVSQRKNFTIMLSSFGCPYKCSYCAITKFKPFVLRDPYDVAEEIEFCYRNLDIREIDFFDGVMLIDKKRILTLCEQIKKRKLDIYWSCRSRIDHVDEEILEACADSGCKRIFYGVETASHNIMKLLNKRLDVNTIKEKIKLTRKYGIRPLGFFMIGSPGETVETANATIEFSKRLGLDYAQYSRTIAKPMTDLDQALIKATKQDFWRDYVSGKEKERRLLSPWTDLSQAQIESLVKKAYLSFYFRPGLIFKVLLRTENFAELLRYIRYQQERRELDLSKKYMYLIKT